MCVAGGAVGCGRVKIAGPAPTVTLVALAGCVTGSILICGGFLLGNRFVPCPAVRARVQARSLVAHVLSQPD